MHKNSARGLLLLESTGASLHQKLSNHNVRQGPSTESTSKWAWAPP